MVDRQIAAANATVLAGVVIANENFPTRQLHTWPGPPDHVDEPNHRRGKEFALRGHDWNSIELKHLCLLMEDEAERATNRADVKRLVVLV